MDCSNMNQRRCGCNCGCGIRGPQMIQPGMDLSCGEPPTIIPDRPVMEPRREVRGAVSCGCGEGGMIAPNCPMPVAPPQTCAACPDTSVGGMEMYPVAMGYVPWQQWQQTYALDRGLCRGTIFPDLDLPFMMGRCR